MVPTEPDLVNNNNALLHHLKISQTIDAPFQWAGATDKGKVREENEDAFWVEPELGLFVVSDGMGGHRGGELASSIVIQDLPVMVETRIHKLQTETPRSIRSVFKKTIIQQNLQLHMEGHSESGYKDMGATLAMLMLRKGRAYIANLGDSRIYRLRNSKLKQLTRDHSVVSELIEKGKIEPSEADNHHAQGQITHYVGMEKKPAPHVKTFMTKKADRFCLCSDGLTDMVDDKTIHQTLSDEKDCHKACQLLIEHANKAGGHDNITAVIVDCS